MDENLRSSANAQGPVGGRHEHVEDLSTVSNHDVEEAAKSNDGNGINIDARRNPRNDSPIPTADPHESLKVRIGIFFPELTVLRGTAGRICYFPSPCRECVLGSTTEIRSAVGKAGRGK